MAENDEQIRVLFANLIRDKLELFRSVAIKIVNTCADADDAVQETLPQAWDRRRNGTLLVRLDSAIDGLQELYRETVHIAVSSGLTGEEAAKQPGCSTNTLYQRIHKAKIQLREAMGRWKNE